MYLLCCRCLLGGEVLRFMNLMEHFLVHVLILKLLLSLDMFSGTQIQFSLCLNHWELKFLCKWLVLVLKFDTPVGVWWFSFLRKCCHLPDLFAVCINLSVCLFVQLWCFSSLWKFSLDFPPKYQDWAATDPADLFQAPVVKTESNPKVWLSLFDSLIVLRKTVL